VLGHDVQVPAGAQIGHNCVLFPTVGPDQLASGPVGAGKTIRAPGSPTR
jgi:hypothetical protein